MTPARSFPRKGQKPILLAMLSGAALLSAIGGAVNAGASPEKPAPKAATTRMGASIEDAIDTRDRDSAAQARALDLKEQTIRAAQARLAASLKAKAKSDAGQASPNGVPPAAPAEPPPDPFDALAKIYQAMKPAKAAPVFEQLDLEVQTGVARRMRERSVAMILAAMSPPAAARLSMALAGKRPTLGARTIAARPKPAQ